MGLLVAVITAVLSLTSIIVIVVAALNIAHVFFTMIAERRGEIGLMRALGASRADVRMIVIVQAAAIGLLASIAGIALARVAAWGANRFAAHRLPPFPFKPDNWFEFEPRTMAIVVLFGLGACVLSALAPAARAARIEPADALAGGV
jgi:ABC-type lipoprotein release transport system permease subunit